MIGIVFMCGIILSVELIAPLHALLPADDMNQLEALEDQLLVLEATPGSDALLKARRVQRQIDRLKAQMGKRSALPFDGMGIQSKAERLTTAATSPPEMVALLSDKIGGQKSTSASSSLHKKRPVPTESRSNHPIQGVALDANDAPTGASAPLPPPDRSPAPLAPSLPLSSQAPPVLSPPSPPTAVTTPTLMPPSPFMANNLAAHPSMVIRTPLGFAQVMLPASPFPTPGRLSPTIPPTPQHSCSQDPRHLVARWK